MRFADCPSHLPAKPRFCYNKCPNFDFHRLGGIFYHHNRKTRLNRLFCALSVFLVCFALALRSHCFAVHRLVSASLFCSIASSSDNINFAKSA